MSFVPTSYRALTRGGWGGRAGWDFRLAICTPMPNMGLPIEDPQVLGPAWRGQVGTVIYRNPGGRANFALIGVSRDSTGTILGTCVLDLFLTGSDVLQATTVSDASGNFRFDFMPPGPFYIVAYKAGSPDVAGTTVNTLQTTAV